MGRASLLIICLAVQALSNSLCQASTYQRPSAAYAPLFTGVIKLADVPAYASPGAPAVISPHGRKRRLHNFPQAPELSTGLLERVKLDAASDSGRRKLQQQRQQQQQQQEEVRFSSTSPRSRPQWSTSTAAGEYVGTDSIAVSSDISKEQQRQLLQDSVSPTSPRRRITRPTGWSGLWWAEAGGVGLAAGPNHVIHAVSTVLAIYTIDPQTGSKQASKILALQDLFAPVGAANCKEGVYDAIPMYDKHARRFLIAATCSGKGAVLLAATATADPMGSWFLFNLIADGAATGMACRDPVETALADSVRVTYNTDGVYLSLFNYCPSKPEMSGATILALPKHKVYKGAPNFVYGVFSADQILTALQSDPQAGGSSTASDPRIAGAAPSSFRQCQPAPPVTAEDAIGGAAYFVCDHIGPDSQVPRSSFTLVAITNTGALWQYAGTQDTSPTPFLVATLVDRGGAMPLSSNVMLPQPEGGSGLHAGGTTPPGFWSGSAALSGGKVYTVDRVDLTNMTVPPPLTPVTMPSLQWTEIDIRVSLSGSGDCSSTRAWGSKWDWNRDWSTDWGKDFDLEWQDNKEEAETMQHEIEKINSALQQQHEQLLRNCTGVIGNASAAAAGSGTAGEGAAAAAATATEIGDGSLGTTEGKPSLDERLRNCTAGSNSSSFRDGSTGQQQQPLHHRKMAASTSTDYQQQQQQQQESTDPVSVAVSTAAKTAVSSSKYAVHWSGSPLPSNPFVPNSPSQPLSGPSSSGSGSTTPGASALPSNHFASVDDGGVSDFAGWDLGCWYCAVGTGGVYYSSSWFYRYWYAQWNFGWYRRYKRTYAPGWRHPMKWVGRRHMLQMTDDNLSDPAAAIGLDFNKSLLQNDTMIIPPCLRTGLSYKNTCKKCDYTNLTASIRVNVTRSGTVSFLGADPLGFVAPAVIVLPGGSVVISTGFSGPGNIPDTNQRAYPGVATLTIPRRSTTATLKVLRAGVGKVKSRTGRWTDYSSVDITMLPPGVASTSSNEAAGVSAGSAHKRVHFGVQWSQRVVQCLDPSLNSTTSGTQLDASNSADLVSQQSTLDASSGSRTRNSHSGRPTCAMPSPWLGQLLM